MLGQFNLDHCIECGACEYICPSNLPLMQSIVLGKVELQKMMYAK
ncbi:4Fe-4S binding protein [Mesonia mobilis]